MLKKRDPIEKILLDHEKITEKILEEIKHNDFQKGKYLGKVLVDHGYVHSQVILETLSQELGFPYLQAADFPKSELPVPGLEISEVFLREKTHPASEDGCQQLKSCRFRSFRLGNI